MMMMLNHHSFKEISRWMPPPTTLPVLFFHSHRFLFSYMPSRGNVPIYFPFFFSQEKKILEFFSLFFLLPSLFPGNLFFNWNDGLSWFCHPSVYTPMSGEVDKMRRGVKEKEKFLGIGDYTNDRKIAVCRKGIKLLSFVNSLKSENSLEMRVSNISKRRYFPWFTERAVNPLYREKGERRGGNRRKIGITLYSVSFFII